MRLKCTMCGEDQIFNYCEAGTRSTEALNDGQVIGSYFHFEPMGSSWYECGICESAHIEEEE